MAFRKKLSKGQSRKSFRKGAQRVHKKNLQRRPIMRGGIRL